MRLIYHMIMFVLLLDFGLLLVEYLSKTTNLIEYFILVN